MQEKHHHLKYSLYFQEASFLLHEMRMFIPEALFVACPILITLKALSHTWTLFCRLQADAFLPVLKWVGACGVPVSEAGSWEADIKSGTSVTVLVDRGLSKGFHPCFILQLFIPWSSALLTLPHLQRNSQNGQVRILFIFYFKRNPS